jgi:hypothetical protein
MPNGRKIDQVVKKCTSIFHCKTLQNLPKLIFLVYKYTIWQPYGHDDFKIFRFSSMSRYVCNVDHLNFFSKIYLATIRRHEITIQYWRLGLVILPLTVEMGS